MKIVSPPRQVSFYGKFVKLIPYTQEYKEYLSKIDLKSNLQIQFPEVSKVEDFDYFLSNSNSIVPFVILKNNEVVGIICLFNMKPEEFELDFIFYFFSWEDSLLVEACFLILQYAMDIIGYKKVSLKIHELDDVLKEKASKIGFQFDAVCRNFLRRNKEFQNVLLFSLIDQDWSKIKKRLYNKSSL
jgi:RimJ/RimL family protein N-acetyltransferase